MLRSCSILAFVILAFASFPLIASGQAMTETRLHAAAANDDVAAIEELLAEGAGIDARDRRGRTALLVATHAPLRHARDRGYKEIEKILLAANAR